MTFGESTSGKSSALGVVPGDGTKVWGKYIYKERRGEVRKRMDVPLHYPPFKGAASRRVRIARRLPGLL
jgi:hypothetical protein